MVYFPQTKLYFGKTIKFHVPFGPFYFAILKKNYSGFGVMKSHHFEPKMVRLPKIIFFFRKTINIIFMYFLAPFIKQNFKVDPEL